jgi:hypothetical protein
MYYVTARLNSSNNGTDGADGERSESEGEYTANGGRVGMIRLSASVGGSNGDIKAGTRVSIPMRRGGNVAACVCSSRRNVGDSRARREGGDEYG